MNYLIINPEPPKRTKRKSKLLAWLKLRLNKILCWAKGHDWTCNASEGIPPTRDQIERGAPGFEEYAEMRCKRCKHTARPIKFDL